jgi:hypothetical protein
MKTYQLPSIIQTGKKYGMVTMNESLMDLAISDVITLEEAFNHSVDKQDMNNRINLYLLDRVENHTITPRDAVEQSYFKSGMVDMLKKAGLGKAVQEIDLNQFKEPEMVPE